MQGKDLLWCSDFRSKGMEINDGMVVIWRGHHYFGAEGMHLLAILGDESGMFGMLNRFLFHNRKVAAAIYPLLAAGRTDDTHLLRRKLIPLEIPSPLPPLPSPGRGEK